MATLDLLSLAMTMKTIIYQIIISDSVILYSVLMSSRISVFISVVPEWKPYFVFYLQLKKVYPDAQLKLPGKRFWGNFDPKFIKERRDGLHDFTQKLICHPGLSVK